MLRVLSVLLVFAPLAHALDIEDRVHKSVPGGSARKMILDAEIGSIKVASSNAKNIDVEVYFRGDPQTRAEFDKMLHDFKLDVSEQAGEIHIAGRFENGWKSSLSGILGSHNFCRRGMCLEYSSWLQQVEFRVALPGALSIEASTASGSVVVEGVKREVNARTSGGSIRVSDAGGDVDVRTSGGAITVDHARGRVKAHTSGGPIQVLEAVGAVDASTSGGSVTATLLAQPSEECRFTTSGGSITVTLSKNIHLNLDASTSGGRVSTDFPVTLPASSTRGAALRTPINGGGPPLYLHTSGGGIHVRQAS